MTFPKSYESAFPFFQMVTSIRFPSRRSQDGASTFFNVHATRETLIRVTGTCYRLE